VRLRISRRQQSPNIAEWGRYLTDRFLLLPAANHLPLIAALTIATSAGFIDLLLPTTASRVARLEIAASTGLHGWLGLWAAGERLAMARRDLVYEQRMAAGRDGLAAWTLTETNSDGVQDLLAAHQPFLLATAHFPHAATYLAYRRIPSSTLPIRGGPPARSPSPRAQRRELEWRLQRDAREGLLDRHPAPVAEVPDGYFWGSPRGEGAASAVWQVLATLTEPGAVGMSHVDAYWEQPSAYRRPFAGMRERGFGRGIAAIARLAQCPVVPFVAVFGPQPQSAHIEWGEPIAPPRVGDRKAEQQVLDTVIDWLEQAVGRYPVQYAHPLGVDRQWDAVRQRWHS
jgi:hypothetical protein